MSPFESPLGHTIRASAIIQAPKLLQNERLS